MPIKERHLRDSFHDTGALNPYQDPFQALLHLFMQLANPNSSLNTFLNFGHDWKIPEDGERITNPTRPNDPNTDLEIHMYNVLGFLENYGELVASFTNWPNAL